MNKEKTNKVLLWGVIFLCILLIVWLSFVLFFSA